MEHDSIEHRAAISINSGECMVIYRSKDEKNSTSSVDRVIKHGPCKYVPRPEEWSHDFRWHGTDPKSKAHQIAGTSVFNKLRTVADQIYYNVLRWNAA